jgi:hypothetical protein
MVHAGAVIAAGVSQVHFIKFIMSCIMLLTLRTTTHRITYAYRHRRINAR